MNLVEEAVNPPNRTGKSNVGRKRHTSMRLPRGKKPMTHLGNYKYFTATGAKSGEMRNWREGRKMSLNELFIIFR